MPNRILTFLLLATVSTSGGLVQASIVHRCRQADGVIAYRDTGCLAGETRIARLELAEPPPMDSSSHAAIAAPARSTRTARDGAAPWDSSRAMRGDGSSHSTQTLDRIVAHECRFGEQRWVQAEACPATLAVAAKRGGKPARQRVDETRLTALQVCGALRAISARQAPGEGSARRAYGMNRLRQQHGC